MKWVKINESEIKTTKDIVAKLADINQQLYFLMKDVKSEGIHDCWYEIEKVQGIMKQLIKHIKSNSKSPFIVSEGVNS